jgi:hypothetical protein
MKNWDPTETNEKGYQLEDKKRTVGVRAGIGHREEERFAVLESEILVFEGDTVDGFAYDHSWLDLSG